MIKKVWKLEMLVTVAALLKFFEDHPEIKDIDLPNFPSLDDYMPDNLMEIRLAIFASDSGGLLLTLTVEYQTPVDRVGIYQTSINLSEWTGNLGELERAWELLAFDRLHPSMVEVADFGAFRVCNLEGPNYGQGLEPVVERLLEQNGSFIPTRFTVFENGSKLSAVIFMSSVNSNGVSLTPFVYWIDNVEHDWELGQTHIEQMEGFTSDFLSQFGEIVSSGTVECEF